MKKISSLLLSFICMLFLSSLANAAITIPSATPIGSTSAVSSEYLTDILIVNYSSRFIDIYVPALRFEQRLYPYYQQHVVANDSDPKRVILYDYRGDLFFDELVSPYDLIEVYDSMDKTIAKRH